RTRSSLRRCPCHRRSASLTPGGSQLVHLRRALPRHVLPVVPPGCCPAGRRARRGVSDAERLVGTGRSGGGARRRRAGFWRCRLGGRASTPPPGGGRGCAWGGEPYLSLSAELRAGDAQSLSVFSPRSPAHTRPQRTCHGWRGRGNRRFSRAVVGGRG